MPCERCKTKFTLITWKKSCFECHRLFCRNCLSKGQTRSLCQNCIIFTKRPLSRTDLAQLKVRELIFYLQSKHISTSGCVEKDDLINLVIAHVNSGASSPRTPPGSFSTASSPRGSVPSGGSSRNGSFQQDATGRTNKNCSNPFDQIKNTCQNLFSNITDKFNGDVPNESNGSSRSPNERPNGFNIHAERQQHIFSQPRFGSNNVYSVDPAESRTDGTGRRGDATSPANNSNQRESMETGRSPASERLATHSGSSGTTSGADSSAASSSFSSPSRAGGQLQSPLRDPEQTQTNERLDDRIESILAREGNANGCECCSDDEEGDDREGSPSAGDQEAARKSKLSKRKSVSHTNLLLHNSEEAGPSQTANVADNPPPTKVTMELKPDSNSGATTSSSFDELLIAEVGQRSGSPSNHTMAEETIPLVESDTEQWQIVSVSVTNGGDTQELICELPMADVTLTQDGEMSDSSSTTHSNAKPQLGDSPIRTVRPMPAVTRRRSDSFLLHSLPSQAPDSQQHQYRSVGTTAVDDDTNRGSELGIATSTEIADGHTSNEAIPSSSHYPAASTSSSSGMCLRCGKRRNGIRRQLKKFRRQLESATGASEADKRRQLEAFLSYLERRSKGSFDFTDTDSITEEASVSEEANEATARLAPSGELGATSTRPAQRSTSTVPPAPAHDETICTNLYSSGNLQLMNMKQIKLTDIKESADLDVLSVKQLKEILMLNRVDFKGCCEKAELRERVLRLWRDDRSIRSIEMLTSDDLCKICMDAPIECVMLECGHMATCTACGKVLSECPICRQYIVRVVRFFRA
uniref:Putative ring finger protein b n=1 Tax=Anopheles braziliensis TaxID=58242 RepID=A0A2M3ZHC6_9DIPT